MSWLPSFFSPDIVNKTVDAVIDAGDAIWFTDEEKAKAHQKAVETKIPLLKAFEPFKLVQRYIAIVFTWNFIFAFWVTVAIAFTGTDKHLELMLKIISSFSIGWIMLSIVVFYFGGGTINSLRKKAN